MFFVNIAVHALEILYITVKWTEKYTEGKSKLTNAHMQREALFHASVFFCLIAHLYCTGREFYIHMAPSVDQSQMMFNV